jgi:uncharacterized membrane protein YciS (DUF1049 family)
MNEKEQQLKALESERERHVTRIFWVGLEIAILFAIPLAVAVVIGLKVGGNIKWIALAVAFVLSWVLMIMRYRKVAHKMEALDRDIKQLREELDIKPRPEHKYPDEIEKELEK